MTDNAVLEDTDPTRRALRVALARCVWAMHYDATQGDGYCEEVLVALQEAAPLLGIAVGEREDRWGAKG